MSFNGELFGHPFSYWLELQKQVDHLGCDRLMRQLAKANAKVTYYEEMIELMNRMKSTVEGL